MALNVSIETELWIDPLTTLETHRLCLLPLHPDHINTLIDLGRHPKIWEFFPSNRSDETVHLQFLEKCFHEMKWGKEFAFSIQLKATGQLVGMTRFYNLDSLNKHLEIGSWIHPEYWRSGVNLESKYAMLKFAFESLGALRLQFRTDVRNERSQTALEKLGAVREGIIRNERIRDDGTLRDAVLYSILNVEWPQVAAQILTKIQNRSTLSLAS